jgi:ATP-binding cassette subfamily F protein uup
VVSHDRYFMEIVDHLFILEVMEWSKIFQEIDFRAYEDSTEVAQKKKTKQKKRLETKQPTGNLTFNEQKNIKK